MIRTQIISLLSQYFFTWNKQHTRISSFKPNEHSNSNSNHVHLQYHHDGSIVNNECITSRSPFKTMFVGITILRHLISDISDETKRYPLHRTRISRHVSSLFDGGTPCSRIRSVWNHEKIIDETKRKQVQFFIQTEKPKESSFDGSSSRFVICGVPVGRLTVSPRFGSWRTLRCASYAANATAIRTKIDSI